MTISAFEERKTLTWGDTLLELEPQIQKLKREEKAYIKKLIAKGNDLQEQLNEEWLDYGYMSFEQYAKQMYRYIAIQDMVINDLKSFVENCLEYQTNEK